MKPIHKCVQLSASALTVLAVPTFAQTATDGIIVDHVHPEFQDQLGYEVIEHGDFVIAAALSDRDPGSCVGGYVHVYRRTADGVEPFQRLSPSRPTICNLWRYGQSMAVIDEFLFVGCPEADTPEFASGLIEVHRKTPTGYELFQTIYGLPGQGETALLGRSMEVRDGKLWASMSGADITGTNTGALVRLKFQSGQWTLVETIPVPTPDISFGFADFTFEGPRVVGSDGNAHAFVMGRDASGTWVLLDRFVSSSDDSGRVFGAGAGWLLVGDADDGVGNEAGFGRVLGFRWNGASYVLSQELRPSLPTISPQMGVIEEIGDQFGYDLHVRKDRAVIGARSTYLGGVRPEGAAYVFELQGNQWVETRRIEPPVSVAPAGMMEGRDFGYSVYMGDDVDVVGMIYYYYAGTYPGGAFIYERPIGDRVCPGAGNSTGGPAALELKGSRHVSANDLDANLTGLPPSTFGLTVVSRGTGSTPLPGSAQSILCVDTASMVRLPVQQASPTGKASWSLDPQGIPSVTGAGYAPGDTIVVQTWYRDNVLGQALTNLSNAASLTLE